MRLRILSICILFLTASCDQPVSDTGNEKVEERSGADTISKPNSTTPHDEKIRELKLYPRLTNENCEEFLLKYAEEHPQKRVLISTTFGDI